MNFLNPCFPPVRRSVSHRCSIRGSILIDHGAAGFVLAGQNKIKEAITYFDQAIAIDGALGNAWLGRGLCKIRRGHTDEGRKDLQTAATLESPKVERSVQLPT